MVKRRSGHTGQLPGGPTIIGAPHMLCIACFYCLNTDFVGSTNTIHVCLILSTFSFIPVSGCVGIGTSALLCPGAYNAVKTVLLKGLYHSLNKNSEISHQTVTIKK
jgi:hypothetical protein